MRSSWILAATLAFGPGCSQIFGLASPEHITGGDDAGAGSDGAIDADPVVDAALCYGTYDTICFSSEPTGTLTLATAIDTDSSSACMNATPADVCVLGARTVVINATVTVTGSRPLAIVGADTLTIDDGGMLDGGSTRVGPRLGPGVSATGFVCSPGTAPVSPGTAGGAGGSFGGSGGGGGDGTSQGGAAGGLPIATGLRPGCPGQKGTGPNMGGNAGLGGNGGGVIYLLGPSISVKGRVTVGGAGGGAGGFSPQGASGGGGGGTGGMIVIETEKLAVMGGQLLANGGGGGEGSTGISSGMFGADAQDIAAAPGGASLPNGGDGGDGSFGQQLAGGSAGTGTSGGGGGGGAGIIKIMTPMFSNSGGTVSPPKT